uniref:Uncharacterized protein n=1 Tax=Arundo donax TaxID=35708 RepID=A0A0A9FZE7_ARUDO
MHHINTDNSCAHILVVQGIFILLQYSRN